jgi:hypothetical protein
VGAGAPRARGGRPGRAEFGRHDGAAPLLLLTTTMVPLLLCTVMSQLAAVTHVSAAASATGESGIVSEPSAAVQWWLASPLTKVMVNSTMPTTPTSRDIDLAAQKGEAESWQVALRPSAPGLELTAVSTSGLPSNVTLQYFKVVHVWCAQSEIYPLRGGWLPDILMPPEEFSSGVVPLHPMATHTIWLKFTIGHSAAVGASNASINFHFRGSRSSSATLTVPLRLRVWPLKLPPLSLPSTFATIFNLFYDYDRDGGTDIAKFYGSTTLSPVMKQRYFGLLCDNRIPADNCYRGGDSQDPARPHGLPIFRPIEDYQSLARCGSRLFNVLDVSAVAGNGTMKMNYTSAELNQMVQLLEPTVSALEALGLADRAYVYGFDERPRSYAHAIRQVFGAVKARFPKLRTVAVLRWSPASAGIDLSQVLDIWVNLYSLWDEQAARAWTALGEQKEAWAYHCISPRPSPPTSRVRFLNTFVVRRRFSLIVCRGVVLTEIFPMSRLRFSRSSCVKK